MRLIRVAALTAGAVALALVLVKANQRSIGLALSERVMRQQLGVSSLEGLPDGLHLVVCGSSSPMAAPGRAGPCLLIQAGDEVMVFDAGGGSSRQLGLMGVPAGEIDAIFLTHLHSDHIDGLGEMILQSWAVGGRPAPLPVYGPVGTAQVVAGFNQAYAIDATYRIAHHGTDTIPPDGFGGVASEFTVEADGSLIVYQSDDLTITAYKVDHDPVEPAVAFRIDYKDRRITISGDTAYNDNMIEAARGADLLVHDGLQLDLVTMMEDIAKANGNEQMAHIFHDITDYHATPEQAAQMAEAAGVDHLAFYHLIPPPPVRFIYPAFVGDAAKYFSGPITVTEDGMLFSLPAGTDKIRRQDLL
ncbi:MAG: MBL fold metallo-hydrolase [Pseudomonadota bacterium]